MSLKWIQPTYVACHPPVGFGELALKIYLYVHICWDMYKKNSNTPLHHFCRCCDLTRRGGHRYWRLGTGRASSAAWRQPAHTESSAAHGFPHWNISFAQRYQWSVWWLPTGLWSRWSHPHIERRPGEVYISMSKRRNGEKEEKNMNGRGCQECWRFGCLQYLRIKKKHRNYHGYLWIFFFYWPTISSFTALGLLSATFLWTGTN